MRTFGTLSAVGILALAAGCGGSSSTGVDGGGGAAGGGGGISGNGGMLGGNGGAGGGGGGAAGTCNYPSCLASMATTCQPTGTCVEQSDLTTGVSNQCYANGVKVLTSFNLATQAIVLTYKNGSTTCYSLEVGASATGAETLTVKNASGATIATGTSDGTTSTVTCSGGSAVTLNAACQGAMGGPSSTTQCTTGTCTP